MSSDKVHNYTCNDYRLEMVLLGLKRRLGSEELSKQELTEIKEEIKKLEKKLDL